MENLMNLYKGERTVEPFKDYAIAQILITHRIKEYLDPDEHFPAKNLNPQTKEMLLAGDSTATDILIDEVSFVDEHIAGTLEYCHLAKEADALIKELRTAYLDRQDKDKLLK